MARFDSEPENDKRVSGARLTRRKLLRTSAGAVGAATITGFPSIVRSAGVKKYIKPIVAASIARRETDVSYVALAEIPRILREKYDVELELRVHLMFSLGSDISVLESVQFGFVDIAQNDKAPWGAFTDAWEFANLPYTITDWDMAERFAKSDLFRRRAAKMEADIPVKVLPPIGGGGFRLLSNSRNELRVPEDGDGFRYRSTGSPIEIDLLKAWGANPTPIPWAETYVALQQGTVDGIHVPASFQFNGKMNEVMSYATDVRAIFGLGIQVMNINTWNSMPEEIQKAFMLAAWEAAEIGTQQDRANEEEFKRKLNEGGMEIYQPTEREMTKWREPAEALWGNYGIDSSLLDEMIALREA